MSDDRLTGLLEERLGAIAPGLLADLALVDAGSPRLLPLVHGPRRSDLIANLVHCASAADVTDVLVGGEVVVRARRHVRLDAERVMAALQASAEALQSSLG